MKIAMIVREHHKYGGISKVVAEISERLVNLGHEVHIYTSRWGNTYDSNVIFHKVSILHLDFLGNVVPKKINKLIKGISFLFFSKFCINTKAYDIIHIHGDSLVKADVVTAHSCHKEWLEISKKFVKNPVDWILKNLNPHHWRILFTEKINYRKGNYVNIVALTSQVKKEIIKHYNVPENDIVVIPNGVDLEKFNPSKREKYLNEIREKYNISLEDIVLLFVGYEFKRKGLEYVIKAISRLKNQKIKLIVVGDDNKHSYVELANNLGVLNKIVFVGKQQNIEKFYAASDIFIFPTVYEAFGLVLIEALASGLPVITTKTAGVCEFITHGQEGFLLDIYSDIDSLSYYISVLIENDNLRKQLSQHARKTAERFNWDRITQEYLKLYKQIILSKR